MKIQALVSTQKYRERYVALESFGSSKVVASGRDPSTVLRTALKKGIESPVILFIPKKDAVQVYPCKS